MSEIEFAIALSAIEIQPGDGVQSGDGVQPASENFADMVEAYLPEDKTKKSKKAKEKGKKLTRAEKIAAGLVPTPKIKAEKVVVPPADVKPAITEDLVIEKGTDIFEVSALLADLLNPEEEAALKDMEALRDKAYGFMSQAKNLSNSEELARIERDADEMAQRIFRKVETYCYNSFRYMDNDTNVMRYNKDLAKDAFLKMQRAPKDDPARKKFEDLIFKRMHQIPNAWEKHQEAQTKAYEMLLKVEERKKQAEEAYLNGQIAFDAANEIAKKYGWKQTTKKEGKNDK